MARLKKDGAATANKDTPLGRWDGWQDATANKHTCTNCLYQVLWVARWRTRTRCAAAKPAHPTGASSSTLGVPFRAFFFLIFLSICKVIFISPVIFILFVLKLIDWLFTFANLFQVVNFFSENFFLTAGDFNDCCLFQFYKQINFVLPSKPGLPFCYCC